MLQPASTRPHFHASHSACLLFVSDFDSLVASITSPADELYTEIVLFRATQLLPVYLVTLA